MGNRSERRASKATARRNLERQPPSRPSAKWRPSIFVRRFLYAAPVGLIVALGLTSIGAAGVNGLPYARLMLIAAFVLSLVATVVAESTVEMRLRSRVGIFIFSAIVSCVTCIKIYDFEKTYYSEQIALVPGNEPTPNMRVIADENETGIILGSNFDIISTFPINLITMNDRPLFKIDMDGKNLIIKQLTLYDDRHDVIASVDENIIWTRNDVRKIKPNKHSIMVFDHNNDKILSVDFINTHIIKISGIFRNKSYPLIINDKEIIFQKPKCTSFIVKDDLFLNHIIRQTDYDMEIDSTTQGVSLILKDC